MQVVLVSVGTDGDIFPYVEMASALRTRGHCVTLVASEDYENVAKTRGFAFRALVSAKENRQLFEHPDFWNPLKTAPLAARWGTRFLRRQYGLLSKLMRPETVLVASPGVFAAALVHEKLGVPLASLLLQPGIIPSSIDPPVLPKLAFLSHAPAPVWKLFWLGFDVVGDLLAGPELNRARAALGLKPMRRILRNWLSKQLVIGLFPHWYATPQPDWPQQIQLEGFPRYDSDPHETLAPEVLEFCRSGPLPVAFTFGTGMAHSGDFFRTALEACEILGVRGIFLTKYRDQLPDPLPPSVLHCVFAPFQKLFLHCAGVMHHGGIGTLATAMAAGIPQLIQPICFDQFDNGTRAKRLGIGDCLAAGRSNGKRIAAALAHLLKGETRDRCRELMPRFAETDAFTASAELIEKLR